MTRIYFPCVLLAALAFGLTGCDSNDDDDSDGSSTVTVAGSDAASFQGNALFLTFPDNSDGEDDLLILLFEGAPAALDDDDDFVAFIYENRTTAPEGPYSLEFFGEEFGDVLGLYQVEGELLASLDGELDITASSASRLSGSFSMEAGQPFSKRPATDVTGSFRATRADTTDLPLLFEGEEDGDGDRGTPWSRLLSR